MENTTEQTSLFGTFTDPRDGQTYKTVQIGKQVWLAENLNFNMECEDSLCYKCNPDNAEIYGRFYTWEAAKEACPPGWHLPSNEEWNELENYVKEHHDGESVGTKLKATIGWDGDGNGIDSFGFSALPAGEICICSVFEEGDGVDFHDSIVFCSLGRVATFWSASEYDGDCACNWSLSYYGDDLSASHNYKDAAFSVRLVKDSD